MDGRAAAAALVIAVVAGIAPPARALDPALDGTSYRQQRWTVGDGLPSNVVNALALDQRGYLWVGTQEALARFDGTSFDVIPLAPLTRGRPGEGVTALAVRDMAEIWVGFGGGGAARSQGDGWVTLGAQDGLTHHWVRAIVTHADTVWFGTAAGVSVWTTGARQLRSLALPEPKGMRNVRALVRDPDGTLWAGTATGLLRGAEAGFAAVGPGRSIRALLRARDGNLWIAADDGLHRLRDETWLDGAGVAGVPREPIMALAEDRHGNTWVGTRQGALMRVRDGRGEQIWRAAGGVTAIVEDREGGLWVGSDGGGLLRLADPQVRMVQASGSGTPWVRCVHEAPDGELWAGTAGAGLARVQNGRIVPVAATGDDDVISVHADAPGAVWMVTAANRLLRWRDGRATPIPLDGRASRVVGGDGGRVWVLGSSLWTVTNEVPTPVELRDVPPPVAASAGHPGRAGTWFGGYGWVARWTGGHLIPQRFDARTSGTVSGLHEDADGTLWIALARNGLIRLRGGTFRAFTTEQDLPTDVLAQLLDDQRGRLWANTGRGILWLDKRALGSDDGSSLPMPAGLLGPEEGVSVADPTGGHPAAWRARDGRLWFATAAGLAVVDPAQVQAGPPPRVFVDRILVDGRPTSVAQPRVTARSVLEIRYGSPTFTAPARARLRHRLWGIDQAFLPAAPDRTARYTGLPPGHYRFQVIADDGRGSSNHEGAQLAFEVPRPWHQTWWFLSSCALSVVALGIAVHRLRLRRAEAQHAVVLRERNRIARDMHDDLAQGFCALSVQIETLEPLLDPANPRATAALERVRAAVRASVQAARRSLGALRSSVADGGSLIEAMETVAKRSAPDRAIDFRATGVPRALPPLVEANLLRIADEAVTNAIRHSEARAVAIALAFEKGRVSLTVADDGVGFDPAGATEGFGLLGMRERAAEMNAELLVESRLSRGTKIVVRVPRT